MKSITRTVLLAALAEYAELAIRTPYGDEANRLFAVVTAITPDVVPVPDGEEMEVMMTRYLAKFGVDALRLSCQVSLSGYTTAPSHLDEGAEGAKSRNLALRLKLSADDSARYERLVAAGMDLTIPGIDTGQHMAMTVNGVVERTLAMFPEDSEPTSSHAALR